jgi:hypothetical protein
VKYFDRGTQFSALAKNPKTATPFSRGKFYFRRLHLSPLRC